MPPSSVEKRIEALPEHQKAGIRAYQRALNLRQDWHRAVVAAIEAAEQSRMAGLANMPVEV